MSNNKIIIAPKDSPKERGSWGEVKPFTRIEQDKTKIIDRKQKHKKPPSLGI